MKLAKKMNEDNKNRGRYILYSFVFLILGFIFAFSYRTLGKDNVESVQSPTFQQEEQYREDLILTKGKE